MSNSLLTTDTVLYRGDNVHLVLDSSNDATIQTIGGTFRVGSKALKVLLITHQPITLKMLLMQGATIGSRRETEEYLRTVKALVACGALRTTAPAEVSPSLFPSGGYSSSFVQIKMLNDIKRKGIYLKAIQKEIKENDVVLDLGTGSGIMAIAAAKAGAGKVYAIEPSGILHIAQENAIRSGVADRIEFIRGWSSELKLDSPANLLITDLIGNDPLDLGMWEIIYDSCQRLLTDNARVLPSGIVLQVQLVCVPEDVVDEHFISEHVVNRWEEEYGINFSAYVSDCEDYSPGWMEKPSVVKQWELDESVYELGRVDLTDKPHSVLFSQTVLLDREEWNGIVLSYSAQIGPEVFSSSPLEGTEVSHWYSPVWLLPKKAQGHSRIQVSYQYLGDGESFMSFNPSI